MDIKLIAIVLGIVLSFSILLNFTLILNLLTSKKVNKKILSLFEDIHELAMNNLTKKDVLDTKTMDILYE